MAIILILAAFAVLILAAAVLIFVGSIVAGAVASTSPRMRRLLPIFICIIPVTVLGMVGGGMVIGYHAIQTDGNYIVLGPIAGMIIGSAVGLIIGLTVSVIWWRSQ